MELGDYAQRPATVGSRDRLAFSRHGADTHLYRFDAALPDERIAASSSCESDPLFSPDGGACVYLGAFGGFAIWVAAADGSGAQQFTHGMKGAGAGSPSWAPDGHTIAFDAERPTSACPHLDRRCRGGASSNHDSDAEIRWRRRGRRDGQWIYFSARRGQRTRHLARSGGGGPPRAGDADWQRVPGNRILRRGESPVPAEARGGFSIAAAAALRRSAAAACRLCQNSMPLPQPDAWSSMWRASLAMNPSLHTLDMVTGQDRILGRLEHFPPDSCSMSALRCRRMEETVIYKG